MTASLKANAPVLKLNLTEIIEDIFMVLTEKEREVVVQRFSLEIRNAARWKALDAAST